MKEVTIKARNGTNCIVYGVLNTPSRKKDKVIVFVHGLTGHKNEHQFYNAAGFFTKRGFATLRFDLYSGEKKGRTLSAATLTDHYNDLNSIIEFAKKKYKKVYLVGHSLGGPTIAGANNKEAEAVVLWDPSLNLRKKFSKGKELRWNKKLHKYMLKWGTEYILSREMVIQWDEETKSSIMLEKIKKPTKIICAGKGKLWKEWKKHIKKIQAPHQLVVIKNAGHCFDEVNTEERLFQETQKWLKKFS